MEGLSDRLMRERLDQYAVQPAGAVYFRERVPFGNGKGRCGTARQRVEIDPFRPPPRQAAARWQ
ncbi:hypothetical protein [Paenibacillus dendritiformis]|uniref:hypothetical protein n=1 Tax=Paenibacillus dendritiformis TaxID=130049 RepID=UPI0018CEB6E8|nr:hypothetical protein [Paenibacillus dendritiformis]